MRAAGTSLAASPMPSRDSRTSGFASRPGGFVSRPGWPPPSRRQHDVRMTSDGSCRRQILIMGRHRARGLRPPFLPASEEVRGFPGFFPKNSSSSRGASLIPSGRQANAGRAVSARPDPGRPWLGRHFHGIRSESARSPHGLSDITNIVVPRAGFRGSESRPKGVNHGYSQASCSSSHGC